MTGLETIREKLGTVESWVESRGTWWLNPGASSVVDVAHAMNDAGARFVTITTYELPRTEGFRLEYHWDFEGRLLGLPFTIASHSIASIFELCEAADWIEREIHEQYAIDFTGREYEPLLLRQGDKPGVNLREEAGTAAKPAAGAQKEVAQ